MSLSSIKVLSFNIHKGFSLGSGEFSLHRMKECLQSTGADVVFLQEVLGRHDRHAKKVEGWPKAPQFEFLADQVWDHFTYGQNAVYAEGHHGNAILSKYPIEFWENEDVSLNRFERRGILHARVRDPQSGKSVDLVTLHLNLFEWHRREQLSRLVERLKKTVPQSSPLLIAGDFNDWKGLASQILGPALGVVETFELLHGDHARTFPSWFPLLKLDRIYSRGLEPRSVKVLEGPMWRGLSDHVPLFAEFAW